jgi:hypothetical protein
MFDHKEEIKYVPRMVAADGGGFLPSVNKIVIKMPIKEIN